ncbi:MAG: Fur family transcriptional regulator [Weeksellaceae bacterium]
MTDRAKQLLQQHALRITDARLAVLIFFLKQQYPIDAQQIEEYLAKKKIKTDTATVYRMLTTFADEGLIKKVRVSDEKLHFELADRPHHHHAICTNCGKIEDIEKCLLNQQIQLEKSFQVQDHAVEIYGLCANCH